MIDSVECIKALGAAVAMKHFHLEGILQVATGRRYRDEAILS